MNMDKSILPHDNNSEAAILSSLMCGDSSIFNYVQMISPEMFYKTIHKKIFIEIKKQITDKGMVDLITILNVFHGTEDRNYIKEVSDVVMTPSNIGYYYSIVKELYDKRKIITGLYSTLGEVEISSPKELRDKIASMLQESDSKEKIGIQTIQTIIQDIVDSIYLGEGVVRDSGFLNTGFYDIDKYVRLIRGEALTIAARTSVGKTSFVLTVLWRMAQNGHNVVYFTNETSAKQTLHKLLSFRTGLSDEEIGHLLNEDYVDLLEKLYEYLESDNINFHICATAKTEEDIMNELRTFSSENTADVVCIDLLNKVKIENNKSKVYQIEDLYINMTAFAREKDFALVFIGQINRAGSAHLKPQTIESIEEGEQKSVPRPMMENIKSSGAIEESSTIVMLIWRPFGRIKGHERNGEAYLLIEKNRYGQIGIVRLQFDNKTTEFQPYGGYNA